MRSTLVPLTRIYVRYSLVKALVIITNVSNSILLLELILTELTQNNYIVMKIRMNTH